jgi:hypothetical protein
MSRNTAKKAAGTGKASADAVSDVLDKLRHPERRLIDEVRSLIAAAVPAASEHVKWNAPSFAMSEHFATLNLRARRGIQLVLHLGARTRRGLDMRTVIKAPAGLLDWKGPDRAVVAIVDAANLEQIGPALGRVVKTWARAILLANRS